MKKLNFKNLTLEKITRVIFAIGALLGILFGGSYHRANGLAGILLGAIFWGCVAAFGCKGIFEFILNLVCKVPVSEDEVAVSDDTEEEADTPEE